ncbi:MAG TPA: hypothetical protein PKG49_08970 [Nitrosomonas mobilis]|nr:hypothetical protein [Nitrosomonas mobilis]
MMSEEKIQQPVASDMKNDGLAVAPQLKRRRLLKSTVAIPVIMTLSSGAALARTSNLVGAVDLGNAATVTNAENQSQIVCVIPDPNEDQTGAPPYDLGTSPQGILGPADQTLADQAVFCQGQGGILISATAFTSLQGKGLHIL